MMLVCQCSNSTLLPEQSGGYNCLKCGARIELTYFRGPDAWAQWQRSERQRVFARAPFVEPPRVEWRPAEAAAATSDSSRSSA
jgi:hypothetical protein